MKRIFAQETHGLDDYPHEEKPSQLWLKIDSLIPQRQRYRRFFPMGIYLPGLWLNTGYCYDPECFVAAVGKILFKYENLSETSIAGTLFIFFLALLGVFYSRGKQFIVS